MTGFPAFSLALQEPRLLTAGEEAGLLEAALRLRADDEQRLRLARLYLSLGRNEAVAPLLRAPPCDNSLDYAFAVTAGLAQLGLQDPEAAAGSLTRAMDHATNAVTRSLAQGELGKAQFMLRRLDEAAESFRQALAHNPHNTYAFTRMAKLDLVRDRAGDLLSRTAAWIGRGQVNCGVLAGRFLALAAQGRHGEAAALGGLDDLLVQDVLETPAGWEDLASFNKALAAELLAHPGGKLPISSRDTPGRVRVDDPLLARSRVFPDLARALKARVEALVATLAVGHHVWIKGRPGRAVMDFWSMITRDDGYDAWHMHHRSWLSGVYYVDVPDPTVDTADFRGGIALGTPDLDLPGGSLCGRRVDLRPQPGLLLLFPSHLYHRTYPSGCAKPRISVAFDVIRLREPPAGAV